MGGVVGCPSLPPATLSHPSLPREQAMRNSVTWIGCLLLLMAPLASAGDLRAQVLESYEGYGVEPGDAIIVIFPEDLDVGPQGAHKLLEVTEGTRTDSAGNCEPGPVTFQQAELIDPHGETPPVKTEIVVLFPDDSQLSVGARVGSWRPGGSDGAPCGPGYQMQRGHVLDSEY